MLPIRYSLQLQGHTLGEFPGGPVVRTPCFHSQDMGSVLSGGTKIPQVMQYRQKKKAHTDISAAQMIFYK